MYIHSNDTICQRRSQPRSLDSDGLAHESTRPHPPRPMPHRSSCEAKLGRENSIPSRHSKAQPEEGRPSRSPYPGLAVHRGVRQFCFACWLARWLDGMEINPFTWPAMTRLPAALRNLVKLERRRGVALVIRERRARNPRRPVRETHTHSCRAVTRLVVVWAAGGDRCRAAAAKPQSHDGRTMPRWKRFLGLR